MRRQPFRRISKERCEVYVTRNRKMGGGVVFGS
jgi:hypothetical protein